MRKILKNAVRCNCCGDIIESTHRHDFKTCSCGRVSVDGGLVNTPAENGHLDRRSPTP